MRAVVQRVGWAKVEIGGEVVGRIDRGMLVLVAVHRLDSREQADWLANKLVHLRVFDDGTGKMNLSIADVGGEMLIVSQFTLYGNCRKGNRPSYVDSASPEIARSLYEYFVEKVRSMGISVQEGEFQAHMHVSLLNDGPVTVIVDTPGAVEN
ncbi:MAG: D-tyrosyl-tRNA(Tyr) deacylase [bacterium]|nr:D-tyrosyl-tRNA(Tyr) deacylase [bacterium]